MKLGFFFVSHKKTTLDIQVMVNPKRRGWDSNPRALSDKRFSRPPRYDHFDTSAHSYLVVVAVLTSDMIDIIILREHCQHFFILFFQKNFCDIKIFWRCDLDIFIRPFHQFHLLMQHRFHNHCIICYINYITPH